VPDIVDFTGSGALLVLAAVLVFVLLIAFAASRYRVANANEALIVAGSKGAKVRDASGKQLAPGDQGIRVVVGGGTVVWPLLNRVGRLELTARQIKIILPDAITSQGIKVAVEGVATFKIGRDVESIRNAAERFLGTNPTYIDDIVKNVLEGSLRSIVGTLTIEELIMDREKLLQRVQDSAKLDLSTTGVEIDAFTIQSIEDASGYITQLGLQKLAPVTRDAKIAQALADQESAVKQAEAEQIKINASRDVALSQAEAEQLTTAARARAQQAGPLAQAMAQQEVVRKQTELAILEAERREKELLATTIKPAEADAQAAISRAQGERNARIAIAEADARSVQLTGEAEAGVVLTKGQAIAEALALKAEAYQGFNQAAVMAAILEAMPAIVAAAAEPMSAIDSLTVLSTDGASSVVRTTTETVAQANATIKSLTGLDVASIIGSVVPNPTARPVGGTDAPRKGRGLSHHLGEEKLGAEDVTKRVPEAPSVVDEARAKAKAAEAEVTVPAPAEPAIPAAATEPAPAPATPPAPAADSAPASATTGASASVRSGAGARKVDRKTLEGVDAALRQIAHSVRQVPGTDSPAVRALTLESLRTRAPGSVREVWERYASFIPAEYRSLTLGQLLDRYVD
jgi:flotillin